MRKKIWISLVLLLVIPGLLCIASCAKKAVKVEPAEVVSAEDEAARKAAAEAAERAEQEKLAKQRAIEVQRLKEEQAAREKMAARNMFINENIYFDFDKYNLLPLARKILKRKADWLWNNPDVSVIIEGHCDERGTNEYNLALGDRRAESAKAYLVDLGIARARLTTVSYGEERPVDPGHNEVAWAKNRRAHFTIE
ncbi:MAG: peptidoglycan-associated lipoprotein Pal [Desulfobacterales bacterium]|uniref:Peptidoglycan-associated protein n=1 Tax=Candidatus Desulfaltia bathyphila TaxID=2841697 RepID=A0A8J6TBN9_9BACT|nr:peptidoglycan-associated lipoprotein Pal [Candidatus Desulfaltia bathyphila]MBL7196007.1 peptidoglycan-associated lipoprotein Pal [Desulfobacterales bacterium]MBL7207429.1 peptidoglycan-associated lipoprotein Pal [Desulfobacterales bacterium]